MIKDRLRTLLNIRVKRESPVIGAKPTDQLWYFFSLQGWREITFARDRRKYVDLPRASFDLLARCTSSEREMRYRQLIASASRSNRAAGVARNATGNGARATVR